MSNAAVAAISVALYILLAPGVGGLLQGVDRKATARMQGRQGPPLLQSFYDVGKLLGKETKYMNHIQIVCHVSFLIFVIFTGALFFGGGDLLLIFFALTTANLCLILAATTCNSPYAAMGANREMLQTMAYEPMVLLTAVGFYLATGSFKVSDIVRSSGLPPIVYLPGVFCGFLFILTIKLRKHPFDLSTSHHAHQEMVKGLTTEFNGVTLLIVEVSHWYENVFLMGIIALFFINGKPWSYALAAVAVVLSYFLEILIDNTNARLKWQRMFKTTWAVTMIIGVINIFVLQVLKGYKYAECNQIAVDYALRWHLLQRLRH